jgi:flagellar biosynthetic protein FlhB
LADSDSGEKTEEPTPKKREDARKKGDVPDSKDTSGFIVLFISLAMLYLMFDYMVLHIKQFYVYTNDFYNKEFTQEILFDITFVMIKEFFLITMPIMFAIAIAGLLGTIAQIGFLFTTEKLKLDIGKLNPIKGVKNIISVNKMVDGLQITLKSFTIFGIAFWYFIEFVIPEYNTVIKLEYFQQLEWLIEQIMIIILIIMIILFVFAVADFVIKRVQYTKKLKMTKQEVKEEFKQMEGSQEVKGKIKQKRMEIFNKIMQNNVKSADVVVTNPTHYSVAIRYDRNQDKVPVVVAKGMDRTAFRIREIAKENDIPIYEDKPLARQLYAQVDVGEGIPEKLWGAVATILSKVMDINQEARK